MSEKELTPEQKAYLDQLIAKKGIEHARELMKRFQLYLGTDEDRAKLREMGPLN